MLAEVGAGHENLRRAAERQAELAAPLLAEVADPDRVARLPALPQDLTDLAAVLALADQLL